MAKVYSILSDDYVAKEVNFTDIFLIHKKKSAMYPSDFHPIGLCNSIYKITSKVLSNHLKLILPSIIIVQQSAFVKNCNIYDNALAALEIIHLIRKSRAFNPKNRKNAFIRLKLDLRKVFDRIEWCYVESFFFLKKKEFINKQSELETPRGTE